MNTLDTFLFAYRAEFGSLTLTPFIWGGLALLISFFLFGLLWGKSWNRRWSLGSWSMALNLLAALLLAGVVFGLSSAAGTATWIDGLRNSLVSQVSASGALNREIFRDAWKELQPLGGQNELTSPEEGGNELRLNNSEEARVLSNTAAADVKRHLLAEGPFALGAPMYVHDPAAVAEEVRNSVPAPTYPVIIGPANAWSKAAVEAQVYTALDSANKTLGTPLATLRSALLWAVIVVSLLQILLTAVTACGDIKAYPVVH